MAKLRMQLVCAMLLALASWSLCSGKSRYCSLSPQGERQRAPLFGLASLSGEEEDAGRFYAKLGEPHAGESALRNA